MRTWQHLALVLATAIAGMLIGAAVVQLRGDVRQVPEWLLVAAVLAATIPAWLASHYARNGAARSRKPPSAEGRSVDYAHVPDKSADDGLAAAISPPESRHPEYAELIASTVRVATRQLDDVRLPLHILLDNHFGELNENQEEMLGAAREACERVGIALRELHDVVELDLGTLELRVARVSLADVAETTVRMFATQAEERGIQLLVHMDPGRGAVLADRTRLQEIFSTLMGNAVAAAAAGSCVVVEGRVEEGRIVLTIRAPGVDFDSSAQQSLARRIVAAHGGTIEAGLGAVRLAFPPAPTALSHERRSLRR